jgi:hypothetical protein
MVSDCIGMLSIGRIPASINLVMFEKQDADKQLASRKRTPENPGDTPR